MTHTTDDTYVEKNGIRHETNKLGGS